jgi:hypothetical protein
VFRPRSSFARRAHGCGRGHRSRRDKTNRSLRNRECSELAATGRQRKLTEGHIMWTWNRQPVRVGFDHLGEGSTLLLLPAFSSISTRQEMRPLQERLASEFATVAIDWPGFGAEPRPPMAWGPVCELSAARPHPRRTAPIRDSSRWSCCNLRALGCCSQAWVAWTSVRRCADMAWPIADYDAGPTFGRSLDYPSKRSSITWLCPLSPQREYSSRAHDGARARL